MVGFPISGIRAPALSASGQSPTRRAPPARDCDSDGPGGLAFAKLRGSGGLKITHTYFGRSLLEFSYNGPQNPILIVKAPIVRLEPFSRPPSKSPRGASKQKRHSLLSSSSLDRRMAGTATTRSRGFKAPLDNKDQIPQKT